MSELGDVKSIISSHNKKMHILLTGAGSFIGLTVTKELAKAGFRVTATYRGEETSAINTLKLRYPNIEFIHIDITDKSAFVHLPAGVDTVIHMAALAPSSDVSMDEMVLSNVIGTRNIQQYGITAGAKSIIFMSSLSVYGNIEGLIVDENTAINNPEIYGATKYLGERMLAATSEQLPALAIRLPGVVGRGAFRSWMPNLVRQLQTGIPIKIYGSEMPFNSVVHVADVANLILRLLEKPSLVGFHAFPIAASGKMLRGKVVNYLHKQLHSKSTISVESERNRFYFISSKYAADKYGYFPMAIEDLLSNYCSEFVGSGES